MAFIPDYYMPSPDPNDPKHRFSCRAALIVAALLLMIASCALIGGPAMQAWCIVQDCTH